jgi:hypothetical protein
MPNTEISIVNKDLDATINAFEKIKEVAIYLSTSDTFASPFEMKDKENKVIIDEVTGKPKINVADIAICLMTGHELGLNISGSLLLGKKLNQATYLSVLKGRSIGVDLATSMEKIVSIPTKNGLVSYTMVDIISAKLMQGGIEFLPFIKNYAPFYQYYHAASKEEMDLDVVLDEKDDLLPKYFIVDASTTPDSMKAAIAENKIPLTKSRNGYYSKIKMTRTYKDGRTVTMYQRFSTVDAQRANLLPTYQTVNGKLEEIGKGKDNWISNTPQMMNNRCISIPGRIIGADLINGLYTKDELIDAGLIKEDTVETTAEVVL